MGHASAIRELTPSQIAKTDAMIDALSLEP